MSGGWGVLDTLQTGEAHCKWPRTNRFPAHASSAHVLVLGPQVRFGLKVSARHWKRAVVPPLTGPAMKAVGSIAGPGAAFLTVCLTACPIRMRGVCGGAFTTAMAEGGC